jgi:ribosomal protein S18 acetylase RimI-like enzyme
MSRGTRIRFAKAEDLAICAGLDHEASQSVLRSKIGSHEVILAIAGKEIVGYLRLDYFWTRIPYVGQITVAEELRGGGVGTRMLKFLEDHLRKNGHTLLLSSSQANEPRAQHWHRSRGFVACGMISGLNEGGIGEVFFLKHL